MVGWHIGDEYFGTLFLIKEPRQMSAHPNVGRKTSQTATQLPQIPLTGHLEDILGLSY